MHTVRFSGKFLKDTEKQADLHTCYASGCIMCTFFNIIYAGESMNPFYSETCLFLVIDVAQLKNLCRWCI